MIPSTDTYKTIEKLSEGLYREKGSKFIAYAYPVESEEEIQGHLLKLKKDHYSARHYCFAWMLGPERENFRANDDGEPFNSAGKPILGQIESHGLTNVLVVVVRYFGGIKLGVGGLITAYKSAANDALENAEIIEKVRTASFILHCQYPNLSDLLVHLKQQHIEFKYPDFRESCRLTIELPLSTVPGFIDSLQDLHWLEYKKI